MATVDVMFASSAERTELLRGLVADKLSTAAREILAVVDRTVAGFEEEASGLRQVIDRQRRQLQVTVLRIDEEFPVCELTAGGGTEEHKSEPSASLNPLLHFLLHDASNIFQCQHDYTKTADCERLKPSSLIQRNLCVRKRRLEDRNSPRTKSNQHVCPVQELPPAGVILDLLRSTFPQLTGGFDVFTVGSNRKLKLTPEEIQRSIRSTGKGRSALYIRDKRAKTPPTSPEQLPPPEKTDENTADRCRDDNRSHVSSDHSPVENVESNKAAHQSGNSRQQQHVKVEKDGQQRGASQDSGGSSSAHAAAESEGDHGDDDDEEVVEDDDRDDEWKPDKKDKELSEDQTKRWKQKEASSENSDAALSCKVCQTLHGSKNMLIKHAWTHADDPERLCGACGERSESADELRSHLQAHLKTHSCDLWKVFPHCC
ncbi:uncharacterized protein LOC119016336 isoform X1 [Acanthopagrus latus]|uniref:uncharacterized protein LOC119016336 isoform X1 n=1 Tax=Acanthopagrus latus TaxID=8177 RepID=UPI00187C01E7|nr:uncharacterized protein LOC119016336 isoform X1 [Acanthopagrus latus]